MHCRVLLQKLEVPMEWQHIYPVGDTAEHDTESLNCACKPRIDWACQIVVHNSYDKREIVEQAYDLLWDEGNFCP